MDCHLPGSSVHGILQARILEWVAISFSHVKCWWGIKLHSNIYAETGPFYQWIFKWKKVLVNHLCPTLCDPLDCRVPGSSVHRILQARVLEWVAISYSRGSSWPMDGSQVSYTAGRFFTFWATREAQLQILWRKLSKRLFHLYLKSGTDDSVRYAWIICKSVKFQSSWL